VINLQNTFEDMDTQEIAKRIVGKKLYVGRWQEMILNLKINRHSRCYNDRLPVPARIVCTGSFR
jgi:hypothetical protein